MSGAKPLSVNFIIPHRGRIDMLAATLGSVADLDATHFNVSVCVVTQEPVDTVKSALANALSDGASTTLSIIGQPDSLTISELRNLGVAQDDAQYLAFLDADVALSSNWLQAMYAELVKSRVIVSAHQHASYSPTALERVRVRLSNLVVDNEVVFLPGRNLFLQRETFDKVGGFPAHLATCEDYYFTEQASRLGPLYYSTSANYVHLGEDKRYNELFKKEIWRAQSNLRSAKGRKVPFSEWPSFIVPFAVAFCWILTLLCVLVLHVKWALLFFILGVLPVLLYSLRLWLKPTRKNSDKISLGSIFQFYSVYFPARALGSLLGLGQVLKWKG